jgi:hypothetical protein
MQITTPALLFPVVSLFFISFTTRFLGLSSVTRHLMDKIEKERAAGNTHRHLILQVRNLFARIKLIRLAQLMSLATILCGTISMGLIQNGMPKSGEAFFVNGLCFLIVSVAVSVYEIYLSVDALEIELKKSEIFD